MAFLSSLNIGGSALSAHKTKMNIIAQNIANANTTRTEGGGAYRRKIATLAEDNINEFGTVLEDEQERYGCPVSWSRDCRGPRSAEAGLQPFPS